LVGRPKGKRPLGRPGCRWKDNIKMDFRKIGIDGSTFEFHKESRLLFDKLSDYQLFKEYPAPWSK
jgi:hypothetical protein